MQLLVKILFAAFSAFSDGNPIALIFIGSWIFYCRRRLWLQAPLAQSKWFFLSPVSLPSSRSLLFNCRIKRKNFPFLMFFFFEFFPPLSLISTYWDLRRADKLFSLDRLWIFFNENNFTFRHLIKWECHSKPKNETKIITSYFNIIQFKLYHSKSRRVLIQKEH